MPLPFMHVDFKNDARVSYGCSNQQFLSSNFLPNSLSCLIICRTFVVGKLFVSGDNLASRRPAYSKKTLPIASVKFLILDFHGSQIALYLCLKRSPGRATHLLPRTTEALLILLHDDVRTQNTTLEIEKVMPKNREGYARQESLSLSFKPAKISIIR